jgi:uncharacterized membrane protein YeiH
MNTVLAITSGMITILAVITLALIRAFNTSLKTLAVLLDAVGLLTVASFGVLGCRIHCSYFRSEGSSI